MLGVNGKNAVKKNEVIFKQGDTLTQVGIVLSGKVLMQNDWMRMVSKLTKLKLNLIINAMKYMITTMIK